MCLSLLTLKLVSIRTIAPTYKSFLHFCPCCVGLIVCTCTLYTINAHCTLLYTQKNAWHFLLSSPYVSISVQILSSERSLSVSNVKFLFGSHSLRTILLCSPSLTQFCLEPTLLEFSRVHALLSLSFFVLTHSIYSSFQ